MYFPKEKKHFWRPEALALRTALLVLIPFHVVFIICNFVFFDFEILALIFDTILLWLSYYNYMTLNKITIIVHLILLVIAILLSISHIERVVTEASLLTIFIFLFQYAICYPTFLLTIGKKFGAHFKQQKNFIDEEDAKTLKGKLKLKLRDKLKSEIPKGLKKGIG